MDFLESLRNTIERWKRISAEDEWAFQQFRDDCTASLTPMAAFDNSSIILTLLATETDESTATELVETLLLLGRISRTTEFPTGFDENCRCSMNGQFGSYGDYAQMKLRELYRYYRIE
jgi:hypothetical protein